MRRALAWIIDTVPVLLAVLMVWRSGFGKDRLVTLWIGTLVTTAWLAVKVRSRRPREVTSSDRTRKILQVLGLALAGSVLLTNWPLRATFHIARQHLEQIADASDAGKGVVAPIRVSTFRVLRVEVNRLG